MKTEGKTRVRLRGLAASALALALSLALAGGATVAASADGTGETSATGGSTMGILVVKTADDAQAELPDGEELQGNDSTMGILLAQGEAADCPVVFMSQGETYAEVTVEFGGRVERPAVDPVWQGDEWPDQGVGAARPVFDAWCTDAEGNHAYDFDASVTVPLTLYAAFSQGDKVRVTLDPCGGDPVGPGYIERYAGSPFRSLPVPTWTGHRFCGWRTAADGGGEAVGEESIVREGMTLYASWESVTYRVRYNRNHAGATGATVVESHRYGEEFALLGADAFGAPYGLRFAGWRTVPEPTDTRPGTLYAAGQKVSNLASVEGAYADLYAQWEDSDKPVVDPSVKFTVTFDAGAGAFEGMGEGGADAATVAVEVSKNDVVAAPETAPKRAGWQFAGWYVAAAGDGGAGDGGSGAGAGGGSGGESWDPTGASKVPLGEVWDFSDPVTGDMTLHARWDLRLDVTLPVSVGFSVNADTGEVETPEMGRYAIKSRTVRPVAVKEVALASSEGEMQELFEPPKDGDGPYQWSAALGATELYVWSEKAGQMIDFSERPDDADPAGVWLPFAGERSEPVGGEGVWTSEKRLEGDRLAAFTVPAFDYAASGERFDEGWSGEERCSKLGLKLGMRVPTDTMKVRTSVDGPQKITTMTLTVAAQP